MRTTIELPDDLAREAESLAQASGVTLSEIVVSGLRRELAELQAASLPGLSLPTAAGQGPVPGLQPGQAISTSYDVPALPAG